MNQGTPKLLLKDLRVWTIGRSAQLIALNRYRQIDPTSLQQGNLMFYLRLNEGGYKEFNFASVNNQGVVNSGIEWNNIIYTSNPEVVVCPLGTYPDTQQQGCYLNPYKNIYPIFYPLSDTYGNIYWVLSYLSSIIGGVSP